MEHLRQGRMLVWLLLLLLLCVGAIIGPTIFRRYSGPQFYVGNVKVMEGLPPEVSAKMPPGRASQRVAELVELATTNTVINRSVDSLRQLGTSVEPAKLLMSLQVKPIRGTGIIAIEVSAEEPTYAKAAADVVAAEFQRYYQELMLQGGKQGRGDIQIIDPASVYPMDRAKPLRLLLAIATLVAGGAICFVLGVAVGRVWRRKS